MSESLIPVIPPKSSQRRTLLAAAGLSMLAAPWVARAQPSTLRIAATIAETGVERFNGTGLLQGATAYFESVNRAGGIHGRKIELIKADDAFNASRAQSNALSFAADPSVLALKCAGSRIQIANISASAAAAIAPLICVSATPES